MNQIPEWQFNALVRAHGLRGEKTINALRLVKVHGRSGADAARDAGIDQGAVTRGLAKLEQPTCPCCGQPLPDADSSARTAAKT